MVSSARHGIAPGLRRCRRAGFLEAAGKGWAVVPIGAAAVLPQARDQSLCDTNRREPLEPESIYKTRNQNIQAG